MRFRSKGQYVYGSEQIDPRLRQGLVFATGRRPGSGLTALDDSPFNRAITLSGNATWNANVSNNGYCFDFDGTGDYASTASINPLSGATGLTVSCWFNTFNSGVRNNFVSQGDLDAIANYIFILRLNGDGTTVWGISDGTSQNQMSLSVSPSANTWNHIVAVWSPSTQAGYFNGVLTNAPQNVITSLNTASKPIYIGTEGRIQDYMQGKIADVRIYNRALTTSEIIMMYNER